MKLLFIITLLLCISVASALKCYVCASHKSMSDCDSSKKEIECRAGFDRCTKRSIDVTATGVESEEYRKDCSTESHCKYGNDEIDKCKKIDGAICKWDCCKGNLCNGGTAPVLSVFLMVAGALVALLR